MTMKRNRLWVLVTLILTCLCGTTLKAEDRMDWFHKAKFGMFIHWGVYSVPAGEWKGRKDQAEWIMKNMKFSSAEYEKFAKQFNPVKFDAKEWADLAKEAGMKYMVITSKHHDGFCMYDSKLTDYNIVKGSPYKRDPMKDLTDACRKAGLTFCFYYSVVDWHHPEFPAKYSQKGYHGDPNPKADIDKYAAYMKGQVRELLTNYGPIGIMWFDGGASFKGVDRAKLLHAQSLIDMIHEVQPKCLVNNRLEIGGDYGTPEQKIPRSKQKTAFEVCMTLNRHWGYNKHDHQWKESPEVIRKLVDICSKGGNFLLNVGPTAEGRIPDDSIRILKEVGKWMAINSESIYGTTASPIEETPKWGRITAKPDKLYLHVFDWPKKNQVAVTGIDRKIKKAYLLADKAATPLKFAQREDRFRIVLPGKAPDPTDSVIVVEYADKISVDPTYVPQSESDTITIDGIEYEYIATAEREAQIIAGFPRLKVGQSREEVRAALGLPDTARPMYSKGPKVPFRGWFYMYKIKMRVGSPNTNDVCVQVFFNSAGKLKWAVPSHIPSLKEVGGPANP